MNEMDRIGGGGVRCEENNNGPAVLGGGEEQEHEPRRRHDRDEGEEENELRASDNKKPRLLEPAESTTNCSNCDRISKELDRTSKELSELRTEASDWIISLWYEGKVKWEDIPAHLAKDPKLIIHWAKNAGRCITQKDIQRELLEDPKYVLELLLQAQLKCFLQFISWKDLPDVSKYDRNVLIKALRLGVIVPSWGDIPDNLKKDKEIAFWALGSKKFSISPAEVPWVDRAFVLDKLQEKDFKWFYLPDVFGEDSRFAKSLPDEILEKHVEDILYVYDIPALRNDIDFWRRIIEFYTEAEGCLLALLEDHAPNALFSDRDLMLLAVGKVGGGLIDYVNDDLLEDPSFFEQVLRNDPLVLVGVSDHLVIIRHIDFIMQEWPSLSKKLLESEQLWVVPKIVPQIFLNRRHFLKKWLQSGLPFPVDLSSLEPTIIDDQEIFLLIAKHCHVSERFSSFKQASASLRSDKMFMRKVLDLDPALFAAAEGPVKSDSELRLKVLGSSIPNCYGRYQSYIHNDDDDDDEDDTRSDPNLHQQYLEQQYEILRQVTAELETYKQFFHVLCGMHDTNSHLSWIHQQGEETATNLKQMISEYLGAPTGEKLQLLRQADMNLRELLQYSKNWGPGHDLWKKRALYGTV